MEVWTEHTRFAIGLLAILSPLPYLPVFLSLTSHLPPRGRAVTASVAGLTVLVVLMLAYHLGEPLIIAIGTSIASFQIAGGLVIGVTGFTMLRDTKGYSVDDAETGDRPTAVALGIVPVGMPLMAGPGSITAVMLEGHDGFSVGHEGVVLGIIVGATVLVWLTLLGAGRLARWIGPIGLTVFERVFGLIVLAIGVEIAMRGILTHARQFLASV